MAHKEKRRKKTLPLLLAALTLIFNDTVIPRITEEIESLFS